MGIILLNSKFFSKNIYTYVYIYMYIYLPALGTLGLWERKHAAMGRLSHQGGDKS